MLKVIPFVYENDVDELCSNTFILIDEDNNCVVIDPSSTKDGVKNYIIRENLNLKAILLTHGHFDHIRGVPNLLSIASVPCYIGVEDESFLSDSYSNCSMFVGDELTINCKTIAVTDKDKINVLKDEIEVISTPYHTTGSVCFYSKLNNLLFSGDSLFKNGVGWADLPGSKPRLMKKSLEKLFTLPVETKVYPGHGKFSSIENEIKTNPYY